MAGLGLGMLLVSGLTPKKHDNSFTGALALGLGVAGAVLGMTAWFDLFYMSPLFAAAAGAFSGLFAAALHVSTLETAPEEPAKPAPPSSDPAKISSELSGRLASAGTAPVVIHAPVPELPLDESLAKGGRARVRRMHFERKTADLRAFLEARRIPYEANWITSTYRAELTAEQVAELSLRGGVARLWLGAPLRPGISWPSRRGPAADPR